jgi:ribosome-associated protein
MRRRQLPGEPPPPTKGELKRQAHELQALGERLIAAPDDLLAGFLLPEKLHDAIMLARRITSHSALLRQKLYVGKLMRGVDPGPIRAALETVSTTARLDAIRFKRAERWRDRLMLEGQAAIVEFIANCPGAERAELTRLCRAAAEEHANGRPAGAGRELFRWIRERLADLAPD